MKVVEQLAELRALAKGDLELRASELDDKLFRVRLQRSVGQAESGYQLRPLRKELARVRTVLAEKSGRG